MKVIVCQKPGEIQMQTKCIPTAKEGYSILRVKCIGVCGTDIHAFEGNQPFFAYPRILGHELAAEIIQTDSADFQVGDLVTLIPYFHCGICIACRTGRSNCCSTLKVFGVHIDGGMANYIQVPTSSLVAGCGLGKEELAMVEPFAIAAHGISRAIVREGEHVLIVGAGPIGIAAATFAQLKGGQTTVIDVNEERLAYCRDVLKVHNYIHVENENVMERLHELTDGDMASVVIDATGNLKAINNSFKYLAHAGRYVLIGLQKGDISFSHPEFHKKEATLLSSRNAVRADFEEVMRHMKSGEIDISRFITHRIPFDLVETQFPLLLEPSNKVLKALVIC